MPPARKLVTLALGFLAAILILSQLVLGQLILGGNVNLIKSHQHTGYLAVGVALVYIVTSIWFVLTTPDRSTR